MLDSSGENRGEILYLIQTEFGRFEAIAIQRRKLVSERVRASLNCLERSTVYCLNRLAGEIFQSFDCFTVNLH